MCACVCVCVPLALSDEDEADDELCELECMEKDNDAMIGEVTLKQRHRVRSMTSSQVRTATQAINLSKSAKMRIRASVAIPGASEGVLPPDTRPATSHEALHHLAKRVSSSQLWHFAVLRILYVTQKLLELA